MNKLNLLSSWTREQYVRDHGNERFFSLLKHKLLGRLQRRSPFAGWRRRFAKLLGVRFEGAPGDAPVWIAAEVYLDDTFPEQISIGAGTVLGIRCNIICHDDATRRVAPVVIGRGCYVGACAIILPGVHLGDGAVIGAGAVVTKDVPAGETWAGVPARRLQERPARRNRVQCNDSEMAGSEIAGESVTYGDAATPNSHSAVCVPRSAGMRGFPTRVRRP